MIELQPWGWLLAALCAFLVGLSKTGVAGIGILAVATFANLLPARESVGVVLPLLISGDILAVLIYRQHAHWPHLWRLFPWAALGVVMGFMVLGRIDDGGVAFLTGVILLCLTAIHLWRQRPRMALATDNTVGVAPVQSAPFPFALTMGVLSGFTTMIANAAGPIMILYLLTMRLPKMAFLGTAAFFFLVVNLFKVPFGVQLGIITPASLLFNLQLLGFVVAGALVGRWLVPHLNQRLFEGIALAFTVLASLRLVFL